jgi:hypothetical protein
MIDALLNLATFTVLVLCIVGFGADWVHKRVP